MSKYKQFIKKSIHELKNKKYGKSRIKLNKYTNYYTPQKVYKKIRITYYHD